VWPFVIIRTVVLPFLRIKSVVLFLITRTVVASGQVGKWASGQVGKWASGQSG
jgi:hypothetical protein